MTTENNVPVEGEIVGSVPAPETVKSEAGMTTPDYLAIGSFVVGLLNICSWLIPICGCTFSLVGIGLGVAGLKSGKMKWMAIVGIVLSSLGLLASLGNWAYGTWYYMQYPEMNPLNNINF